MGKPKPIRPSAPESKDLAAATQGRGTRLLALVLSALLAVTMLPAAGLQAAYADEPAERPATSGGDVALEGASGAVSDATAASAPVAEEREGGMLVADGLLYTVADGGLSFVGFDGAAAEDGAGAPALEGALAVPAAVSAGGRDVAVVAVDLAEGNVAEGVTALSVPQSIKDIRIETLASAFPSLMSVEVVAGQGSTLPAAAGAAAMRATYSSFGGALLGQATVEVEDEGGSMEAVQCRELLWAPPAAVAVRLPVDCLSIAPGALADARGLETIVCFGDVQRIAAAERDAEGNVTVPGALTDERLASVTVVFPDATPAVPSEGDGRVSASMALNDGATQTDKRHAWVALGLPLERLSMGKPTGALTETVAVTEEGAPASGEAQLISYPGMHPRATDVKHPGEDGVIDMAESGLAFEMKSDMTLSVRWQGDPTATPSHLEIPATVTIDNVTYPVTEIASEAFKGAVFLESVTIPDTVTTVADSAFEDCVNLSAPELPSTLGVMAETTTVETSALPASSEESTTNYPTSSQADAEGGFIAPYTLSERRVTIQSNVAIDTALTIEFISDTNTVPYLALKDSNERWTYTVPFSDIFCLAYAYNNGGYAMGEFFTQDWGSKRFSVRMRPKAGWTIISSQINPADIVSDSGWSLATSASDSWMISVSVLPSAVMNSGSFITKSVGNLDNYYTKTQADGRYALSSGNATQSWVTNAANTGYLKSSDVSSYNTNAKLDAKFNTKLDGSAISNYNTNDKLDAKFNTKVDASDFGTISYNGLDGTDASVFPTSYRKGGTPALPTPAKPGQEFLGWTWARGGASGDSSNLADAFAEAGSVTLSANWGAPSASCFFSDTPLDANSGGMHVIRVAIPDGGKAISSARLKKVDGSGLVIGGREGQVSFALGATAAAAAGSPMTSWDGGDNAWNANIGGSLALTEAADGGSHWLYVGINIPSSAIDRNSVVKSYAPGDYVASLVTLEYELA